MMSCRKAREPAADDGNVRLYLAFKSRKWRGGTSSGCPNGCRARRWAIVDGHRFYARP
jgi:hypothetical protein